MRDEGCVGGDSLQCILTTPFLAITYRYKEKRKFPECSENLRNHIVP
jgi:hypothetical protein